jgi:hypothetical protein
MLLIPRVILGVAFLQVLRLAHHNAAAAPMTGDLANAGYLALAVLLALANAAVWAPALGARLASPLTGVFTAGPDCNAENQVVRLLMTIYPPVPGTHRQEEVIWRSAFDQIVLKRFSVLEASAWRPWRWRDWARP